MRPVASSRHTPQGPFTYSLAIGFGSLRREVSIDLFGMAVSFAEQLQDVEKPSVCPTCFHAYARVLSSAECELALAYVLTRVHQFWDACARVASFPGATGDLAALRVVLDGNTQSCQTTHLHPHARGAVRDSVMCLMDALCRCLAASLRGGSHKKQQNVFMAKHGMWPDSVECIMPYGLAAYARWISVIPTRYPLALLARLTVVARRSVMVGLLQSPSRERVVVSVVQILRRWHVPNMEFPSAVQDLMTGDVSLGRPSVDEATSTFGLVVHFISVFLTGPDRYLDDFSNFARGFERQLHDAILDASSGAMWTHESDVDCVMRAASSLCSIGGFPVHPLVQDFRSSANVHQYSSTGLSVGDAVYVYMQQKLDSRFCSGPSCKNYARETESGRHALSLCGNCKVMRYCSVECQRRDWNIGNHGAPHKTVFPAVCKFIAAGLLKSKTDSMSDFAAAYFDLGFLTMSEYTTLGRLVLADDSIPRNIQIGALSQMMGVPAKDVADEINTAIESHRRSSAI